MSSETERKEREETVRDETFVTELPTKITLEEPSSENPFHTENMFIYGYEHLELTENCDFLDTLFLLMNGELPGSYEKRLFSKLMTCLINPGPRHPATRAAMNSGVVRTKIHNILPMSLLVASGDYLGTADVYNAMRYLKKNARKSPEEIVAQSFELSTFDAHENPLIAPGFGSFYGGADTYAAKLASYLSEYNENGKYFIFAKSLVNHWQQKDPRIGWLISGLAAAVLCDLGFRPRQGCVVFQIAIAPGLAAHGVEKSNRETTDMPFVSEDNYFIDESALAKPENRKD